LKLLNEQEEEIRENGKDAYFHEPMSEPPKKLITNKLGNIHMAQQFWHVHHNLTFDHCEWPSNSPSTHYHVQNHM
jgi:hypothetical protein